MIESAVPSGLNVGDKVMQKIFPTRQCRLNGVLPWGGRAQSTTRQPGDCGNQVFHLLGMSKAHPAHAPARDQVSFRKTFEGDEWHSGSLRQYRRWSWLRAKAEFAIDLVSDDQQVVFRSHLEQLCRNVVGYYGT